MNENKNKTSKYDFWIDLPDYIKAGIKRAQQQAAEGKVKSHEEMLLKYKKYL